VESVSVGDWCDAAAYTAWIPELERLGKATGPTTTDRLKVRGSVTVAVWVFWIEHR
jgi:hypothetical protein